MAAAAASTSFCRDTNASENTMGPVPASVRRTATPRSAASSGSKLCGASQTTISAWSFRFSFLNTGDMPAPQRQLGSLGAAVAERRRLAAKHAINEYRIGQRERQDNRQANEHELE